MTSTFHYLAFRTIAHATEDVERVKQALLTAVGTTAEVREAHAEGFHKNPILVLEAELKARPAIDRFFRRLAEDPETPPTLLRQLESRLDEDQTFFLRLAKQEAYLGRLVLRQDEDAIQVRAKVAAFPAGRDRARVVLEEYLTRLAGPR